LATNHMIATALMRNFCISAMLRWSRLIDEGPNSCLPKKAESIGVIGLNGKSSACLLISKISKEFLYDINTMLRITSVQFNSVAL
jgi:hypothetical protein